MAFETITLTLSPNTAQTVIPTANNSDNSSTYWNSSNTASMLEGQAILWQASPTAVDMMGNLVIDGPIPTKNNHKRKH